MSGSRSKKRKSKKKTRKNMNGYQRELESAKRHYGEKGFNLIKFNNWWRNKGGVIGAPHSVLRVNDCDDCHCISNETGLAVPNTTCTRKRRRRRGIRSAPTLKRKSSKKKKKKKSKKKSPTSKIRIRSAPTLRRKSSNRKRRRSRSASTSKKRRTRTSSLPIAQLYEGTPDPDVPFAVEFGPQQAWGEQTSKSPRPSPPSFTPPPPPSFTPPPPPSSPPRRGLVGRMIKNLPDFQDNSN